MLTDGQVVLDDLTLLHTGNRPASGLVASSSSSLALDGVRVSGARSGKGDGGIGVLMSSGGPGEAAPDKPTLAMTEALLDDNDVAGVVVAGAHRLSAVTSTFRGNGQCGVCFFGDSSGVLRSSVVAGNRGAGIVVSDRAEPLLVSNSVEGGEVGVQVAGEAAPVVRHTVVTGTRRSAIVFADRATGRVDGTVCERVPYGIVMEAGADPEVGRQDGCAVVASE